MKTVKLLRNGAIAGFVILSSLTLLNRAALSQEYIMRGPHGAAQILDKSSEGQKPKTMKHKDMQMHPTRVSRDVRNRPVWITRGPHGAVQVLDKEGIGGPEGSGYYPGYPNIRVRGPHGAFQIIE
jgi:hypothetical protein